MLRVTLPEVFLLLILRVAPACPMDLKGYGIVLLVWTLVLMPIAGVYSHFRLKSGKPLPPKKRRYRAMIPLQCLLLMASWRASLENRLHFFDTAKLPVWYWPLAVGWLVFVAVRMKSGWSRITAERKKSARLTLPENSSEMRYWIPISVLAGTAEEWAYRGVACALLIRVTGSYPLSVLISAAAFGFAHMFHGWRGVAGAASLALLFQLVAFQCECLDLVIAVHICYDLLVGILGMHFLSRSAAAPVPTPEAV